MVDSLEDAVAVSEEFAPEHLQLMTRRNDDIVPQLSNYGSLFVGAHAPVAFGDYVSGTNQTLPVMHCAKFTNGLWVGTFLKTLSIQRLSGEGSGQRASHSAHFAAVEGLLAHQRSAELRM